MRNIKPQIIFWGVASLVVAIARFVSPNSQNLVYNEQLAFGFTLPTPVIIPIMVGILLCVLAWFYFSLKPGFIHPLSFGLIFGGGSSNLFERLMKKGLVADYWNAGSLFTFNLADVGIALGILGLVISLYHDEHTKNRL